MIKLTKRRLLFVVGMIILAGLALWGADTFAGERGRTPDPASNASVGDVQAQGGVASVGDVQAHGGAGGGGGAGGAGGAGGVGGTGGAGGAANVGDLSTASSSQSDASASASTASSSDNSNTVSVAYNATRNNNTPGVYLGGLYPSANCMGVGNLGVSAPGFGIGGGKSYPDPECDKRETARSFMALGYPQEALFILCSTQAARVLARCPYEALPEPEPVKCSDEQCEQAIEKKMDDMRKVWEGE
jgi:hypothetical protein